MAAEQSPVARCSYLRCVFHVCSHPCKAEWGRLEVASDVEAGMDSYDVSNTTGFVSPAGDAIEGPIDLSHILDLRRPHRYPVRVSGDALRERGIHPGDILIADTAAMPVAGRVVIAMVFGDVLVCQLTFRRGQWWLKPSGTGEQPVAVQDDAEIWAVIAGLVRTDI